MGFKSLLKSVVKSLPEAAIDAATGNQKGAAIALVSAALKHGDPNDALNVVAVSTDDNHAELEMLRAEVKDLRGIVEAMAGRK